MSATKPEIIESGFTAEPVMVSAWRGVATAWKHTAFAPAGVRTVTCTHQHETSELAERCAAATASRMRRMPDEYGIDVG